MYFTFLYKSKEGKQVNKLLVKKEKAKASGLLGLTIKKGQYDVKGTVDYLNKLGNILESENIESIKFTMVLHDPEGKIESIGDEYTFDDVKFTVSDNQYSTLLDLIGQSIFKDTTEDLSVEESNRNAKVIEVIQEELEMFRESDEIDSNQSLDQSSMAVSSIRPDWMEEVEETNAQEAYYNEVDQSIDESEESQQKQQSEKRTPAPSTQKENKTEDKHSHSQIKLPDIDDYIESVNLESTQVLEQRYLVEKMLTLSNLIDQTLVQREFPEKSRAFIKEQYQQSNLENIEANLQKIKLERYSKARKNLQKVYVEIVGEDIEEIVQKETEAQQINLDTKREQEIVLKKEQVQEELKRELDNLENQKKYKLIQINNQYATKIKKAELRTEKLLEQYINEIIEKIEGEKKELLEEEKERFIRQQVTQLESAKISEQEDVSLAMVNILSDVKKSILVEQKKIQTSLKEELPKWHVEYEKQQEINRIQEEKNKKENQAQEKMEIEKENQRIRQRELDVKEKELEVKTLNYPEKNDSLQQPIIISPPNNVSSPTVEQSLPINKWVIVGIASLGLLLGIIGIGMSFSNNTTAQTTEKEPLQELLSNDDLDTAMKEYTDKSSILEMQDYYYMNQDSKNLEKVNKEFPTEEGKLKASLLKEDDKASLAAYEELSKSEQEQLPKLIQSNIEDIESEK